MQQRSRKKTERAEEKRKKEKKNTKKKQTKLGNVQVWMFRFFYLMQLGLKNYFNFCLGICRRSLLSAYSNANYETIELTAENC